ncbi:MAG TPA: triose-phosphate isomerase family protein [Candidatus Limnocylindrales bacterium]
MTRQVVGTSWKMNLTATEARTYFRSLVPLVADIRERDLFVLPPFTALWVAREELGGSSIAWGAQDVHESLSGAHTGDVSAPMLVDLGCRYVEVGHPERRRDHGERDRRIARKAATAVECGLEVILSVGESRRMADELARGVVLRHLGAILGGLGGSQLDRVLVAYEPAWAIGAGASRAPIELISFVHRAVREWLGERGCQAPRVIYGGSVDRDACALLLSQPDVDGLFVGRAGLDPVEFARIARAGLGPG